MLHEGKIYNVCYKFELSLKMFHLLQEKMARSYFKQEHDLGMYSVLIDACYFHFYFLFFYDDL